MSSRESKFILIFMVLLFSCTSESNHRMTFYKTSQAKVIIENDLVIHLAMDTVNRWISLRLKYYYYLDSIRESWRIDDWIFFNSKMNRCIINIPIQNEPKQKTEVNDAITILLGEKINGQWWFYDGPQYAVLRGGNYSEDTKTPVSLEFLTYRSRVNALSWYYIEKPAGTCLKKLFSEGYDSYKKCSDEKYIINDQYFEDEFNYRPNFEARQKDYRERFLKNVFTLDTARLNQ